MEITENPFTEALLDAIEESWEPWEPEAPKDEDFIYGPFDDDELPF